MSSFFGPTICGKRRRSVAMISAVSSTDSVVWVTYASRASAGSSSASASATSWTRIVESGASPIVPDDLLVTGVADQEHGVAVRPRSASPGRGPS